MRSDGGHGRDVLYRQEALERAARVHDVSYELVLELAEARETYAGHAVIEFRLDPAAAPLFLDFTGTLRSLRVNGIDHEADHRGHRIWLAPEHLRMHNRIVVDYHNSYDATGDGFHAFRDPEDGATYLYSNLEPYSAHRLFPSFDQPDIKATYRLQVTAPESWQVISAEAAMQSTYLSAPAPDARVPALGVVLDLPVLAHRRPLRSFGSGPRRRSTGPVWTRQHACRAGTKR